MMISSSSSTSHQEPARRRINRKRKRPPKASRTGSCDHRPATATCGPWRWLEQVATSSSVIIAMIMIMLANISPSSSSSPIAASSTVQHSSSSSAASGYYNNSTNNGFQLYSTEGNGGSSEANQSSTHTGGMSCTNGLLTFELSTGFIYKPSSAETLAMMPSTLQLTDCLDYCLHNASCLAINFEMGLCVLLSSSAKQNPQNLYSSQFPVFTIYAEKKCLLQGDSQATKQRHRCQRAWTFERVAGYEMKTRPRRRLKQLPSKEHCMEACLLERDFECRSANWYRQTLECTLSDQDRHSVSQSEAGDQQIKASLQDLYGPSNLTSSSPPRSGPARPTPPPGLYQNYYLPGTGADRSRQVLKMGANDSLPEPAPLAPGAASSLSERSANKVKRSMSETPSTGGGMSQSNSSSSSMKHRNFRQLLNDLQLRGQAAAAALVAAAGSGGAAGLQARQQQLTRGGLSEPANGPDLGGWPPAQYVVVELPAQAPVDYLENNCVYEPNKLCEFRKIQNRVLKTVDSIYQDVNSLEECKQKCLNAPYRCYSFDYGDTAERVCRTSHLDQASLLSVKEPYLDVVGAITYELASCFNVSIQCRAREMVAQVSSSKMFRGKIYVKSRPNTCLNDVRESLQFELTMRYHDENCDVRAASTSQQGVFSNDIVIQHHDRIVTTQDVGLSVYCQYDLGNRSITNNVNLAIDRIDEAPIESKTQPGGRPGTSSSNHGQLNAVESGSLSSPLTITSLATTVVKSPNVTMRITNMNGQPVTSATVGDRLALLFEIKEKTSPFGIFVREIIAMDGKQLLAAAAAANNNNGQKPGYHYGNSSSNLLNEKTVESMFQANKANSVQFIDSDGCPTDANIMGPLIRMDPNGHRVLAPFDAFKFPTSDMVFFRAVVTSCVSECRPVVCQSNQAGPLDESLNYITTTTLMSSSSGGPGAGTGITTPASLMTPGSDTGRNMASTVAAHQPELRASTPPPASRFWSTTSSQELPVRVKGPGAGGELRGTTPGLGAGGGGGSSGDSLTTIPGYGVPEQAPVWLQQQQQQPIRADQGSATAQANVTQAANAQQSTNNNKLSSGKSPAILPASPATSPAAAAAATNTADYNNNSVNNSSSNNNNKLAPINLDTLSSLQRQQLVKLFETKLMQQLAPNNNNGQSSNNISDIADLYAGVLASIMLNGAAGGGGIGGGQSGLNGLNANNLLSGKDESYLTSKRQHESSLLRDASASARDSGLATGDASGRLADFEGSPETNSLALANNEPFLHNAAPSLPVPSGEQVSGAAKLINGLNLAKQQQVDQPKITKKPQNILEQEAAAGGASSPIDGGDAATIANGHESAADIEQPLDSLAAAAEPPVASGGGGRMAEQSFDNFSPPASEVSIPTRRQQQQQLLDRSRETETLPPASQQQQQLGLGKASGSPTKDLATSTQATMTAATTNDDEQRRNRKRDKLLAASKQQALADSYLGAFQSYGKRRRRRQVEPAAGELHDEWPSSGVYMFVRQPQEATYAPAAAAAAPSASSSPQEVARFTQGFIEIYPASEGPRASPLHSDRRKREAEPLYDVVDEMVVQSIKISDRLQFQDEPATSGPGRNSRSNRAQGKMPKKQLVTRAQLLGNQTRSAAFGMSPDPTLPDPTDETLPGFSSGSSSLGTGGADSTTTGWSSSGALSLVIVAGSFIFVQVFLVLLCLMEFNHRRKVAAASVRRAQWAPPPPPIASAHLSRSDRELSSRSGSVATPLSASPSQLYNQISPVLVDYAASDLKPTSRTFGRREALDPQLSPGSSSSSSSGGGSSCGGRQAATATLGRGRQKQWQLPSWSQSHSAPYLEMLDAGQPEVAKFQVAAAAAAADEEISPRCTAAYRQHQQQQPNSNRNSNRNHLCG